MIMIERIWTTAIAGLFLMFAAFGCASRPWGATMPMRDVDRDDAFSAAMVVMANYFSIESADPKTGIIKSRPKSVEQGPGILKDGRPTRQVATISLRREEGQTVTTVLVEVQQQGSREYLRLPSAERYSSIPHDTPAEGEAATTPEQNIAWRTIERDRKLEVKMLDELHRSLEIDK